MTLQNVELNAVSLPLFLLAKSEYFAFQEFLAELLLFKFVSFEQFFSDCVIPDMSNWSGLSVPDQVLQNLSELGFHSPTLVQKRILPVAAHGKSDIIAAAETVGRFSWVVFSLAVLLLKHIIWNPVGHNF